MLQINVITLMPDIFSALQHGVTGRALKNGLLKVKYLNPRDFAEGNYQQIDDAPYGGGAGMVMMYEPLKKALDNVKINAPKNHRAIYLSPQGKKVSQIDLVEIAAKNQSLTFVAGRYEGIDERIIDNEIDEEWSLGDFVLSGGEIAAMAFIDAIARLLPGSLGHPASSLNDSFMEGLLDYPQYTKPAIVGENFKVPEVLLSGNHGRIERWRRQQSLRATWNKRPDLLDKAKLSNEDKAFLQELQTGFTRKGNTKVSDKS
jgi:tRNA (guanine37-N1)-methyltransferase